MRKYVQHKSAWPEGVSAEAGGEGGQVVRGSGGADLNSLHWG